MCELGIYVIHFETSKETEKQLWFPNKFFLFMIYQRELCIETKLLRYLEISTAALGIRGAEEE